jgi:outer membrane protein TolC
VRLILEEAKQRALANNKLLNLAALNVESKGYAIRAMQANYFSQITGSVLYLHFNDDLGTVLTGGGRHVTGPRGVPLLTFPPTAVNVSVLNQESAFANVNALQPITDLLKVRQGVKLAQADQGIAQAQLEKGIRELASGVEQLYWGLLAARKIQAGAVEAVKGAEMLAQTKLLEARIALVEARQGLQQVNQQIADLQEKMNALLDLPLCTNLELVEPPLPELPYRCADDVLALALAASPEIREAQQTIAKADAAVAAGKLDYVPSIAVVGGYLNQQAADYIQTNVGYISVLGSVTFFDGGKRRSVIRERQTLRAMARVKLAQTEDDVRQHAFILSSRSNREVGAQCPCPRGQEHRITPRRSRPAAWACACGPRCPPGRVPPHPLISRKFVRAYVSGLFGIMPVQFRPAWSQIACRLSMAGKALCHCPAAGLSRSGQWWRPAEAPRGVSHCWSLRRIRDRASRISGSWLACT